jgi:hypothetical protein
MFVFQKKEGQNDMNVAMRLLVGKQMSNYLRMKTKQRSNVCVCVLFSVKKNPERERESVVWINGDFFSSSLYFYI